MTLHEFERRVTESIHVRAGEFYSIEPAASIPVYDFWLYRVDNDYLEHFEHGRTDDGREWVHVTFIRRPPA